MLPEHHPERARLDELITAFDEAVRQGADPAPAAWLADWRDAASRPFALAELLCVACELQDFDYRWLSDQATRFAGELGPELKTAMLRTLVHDQAETGRTLQWEDFVDFGISAAELDLRAEGDFLPLGCAVAGRYRLEVRLGGGGFGVVYCATDEANGQHVAVKTPRAVSDDARHLAAAQLVAEGQLLAKFSGDYTPRFRELLVADGGTPVLVMEFIPGGVLADRLRNGPLPISDALHLTEQIALALDETHRLGFVHRDLKAANVLLDSQGRAVLADFGIALEEKDAASQQGMIVGTPGQMSVETLLGFVTDVDGRADIWSLGALLYEMVVGEALISSESREASLVDGILAGTRRVSFPASVPENVQRLVECAVSRDQKQRFDRAADIATVCRALLADPDASPPMPMVRSSLVAWRLGMTLANVWVQFQGLRAALASPSAAAPPAPMVGLDVQMGIAQAHAATSSFMELVETARQINIKLGPWPASREYGEAFYRMRKLMPEDIRRLSDTIQQSARFLESVYLELKQALAQRSSAAAVLLEFGFHSGCSPSSTTARRNWRIWAEQSLLPEAVWKPYGAVLDRQADGDELQAGLVQLNRSVERYLRFC